MEVIIVCIIIVAFIFLMRAFGAWMLRIDDVIYYQKEILKEIKSSNTEIIKALKKSNELKNKA